MKPRAVIDFETFSPADLTETGAYPYAEHPGTGVYWLCYKIGRGPIYSWRPGDPDPADLLEHVSAGGVVVAHNSSFEWCIWNVTLRRVQACDWPELRPRQIDDTMSRGLAVALPASLGKMAAAVGLEAQKDDGGRRLMLQMAKPIPRLLKTGVIKYYDDEPRRERLRQYCATDVEVEAALDERLPPLTERERQIWELDFEINTRGVAIDVASAKAAHNVVTQEMALANREIVSLTNGFVTTITNHKALGDWLRAQGVAEATDTTKNTIDILLGPKHTHPPHVKRVLELRRDAGKASVAKLPALLAQAGADGRARWLLMYGGASRTLRWAGRGAQPQNLPRPELKQEEIDHLISLLPSDKAREIIDCIYGPPVSTLASSLRAMFVAAPGRVLTAADLANIEGRVAAWVAGEEWKLEAFRAFDTILPGQFDDKGEPLRAGPDLYKLAFSRSFGVPIENVSSTDRSIGKVQELFLQYEGGFGAFVTGAEQYGFEILEKGVEPTPGKTTIDAEAIPGIIAGWRAAHKNVRATWREVEALAIRAVKNPGVRYTLRNGKISFVRRKLFLFVTLPNGRDLAYFNAQVGPGRFGESLNYWGVNSKTKQWQKLETYGGKLFENIVQAIARDVLAGGMLRANAAGMPIVLHVHDEIVTEHSPGQYTHKDLARVMCDIEPCYAGLPVAAEGWTGERYQK